MRDNTNDVDDENYLCECVLNNDGNDILSLVVINRSPGDPHGSQFLCQQQLLMMSPDQCIADHVRVRLVMTISNIC